MAKEEVNYARVSTTLPIAVHAKLVELLRPKFSRVDEGKLDKGIMSEWILEQALSYIENKGEYDLMKKFLIDKGLEVEFNNYFKEVTQPVDNLV